MQTSVTFKNLDPSENLKSYVGDKLDRFDKYLYIQCIFSYRKVKNIDWQKDWNFVGEFAHSNDCKYIIADSSNSQIFNLMNNLGAQEIYRTFKFEL